MYFVLCLWVLKLWCFYTAGKPSTVTTLGPRATTTIISGGKTNLNFCANGPCIWLLRLNVVLYLSASCGQRSKRPSSSLSIFRIIGGQVSDIRQQPWQAAITVYSPRTRSHNFLCGGVLIDSCWVLSAAHCFQEGWAYSFVQFTLTLVHWGLWEKLEPIKADFRREVGYTLNTSPIHLKANIKSHTSIYIHTHVLFRIASWLSLHVFELWKET